MFDKNLTTVIQDIQKTIDMCCTEKNISFAVQREIDTFAMYVGKLDPTGIDFRNTGLFNKGKIKSYWSKFQSMTYNLDKSIANFGVQQNVLQNTIITLKNQREKAETVVKPFKESMVYTEDTDLEQQVTVVVQSIQMLENLINEYTLLLNKLNAIRNISVQVFQQAIIIAKKQTDFSKFDTNTYVDKFRQLKDMM